MTTRREFLAHSAGAGLMLGLSGGVLNWTPVGAAGAEPTAGAAPDPFVWFADSPFNLLVDYYTEVSFRPYGSGATRENVLQMLRALQPGYIIIYAKGHSGRTTFPSALKTEHEMLAKDMPAFFREVTRETNTKLFFYYSGLLDGIAGTRHPEWAQKDGDKPKRYFGEFAELFTAIAMCPRSRYWDDWVAVHVRELLTRYEPDGMWVDGDWAGPCTCERCRADPWSTVTDEWRKKFRALIKSLKPDCMYSAGNVGARREFGQVFDWRSGDWFSPNNHRLHASIAMRRASPERDHRTRRHDRPNHLARRRRRNRPAAIGNPRLPGRERLARGIEHTERQGKLTETWGDRKMPFRQTPGIGVTSFSCSRFFDVLIFLSPHFSVSFFGLSEEDVGLRRQRLRLLQRVLEELLDDAR